MGYMTRHLVANRELLHEGRHLQVGDEFEASEVDANYYAMTGSALDARPVAPPSQGLVASETPRRRGRPPNSARIAAVDVGHTESDEQPAAPVEPNAGTTDSAAEATD